PTSYLCLRIPQTDHKYGQKVIVFLLFFYLPDKIVFRQGIACNGMFPILWGSSAYPDRIHLFDLLVMTARKNRPILAGNHPAAIVDSSFYQRISGIKLVLGFHVEDQAYFFSVRASRAFIVRRHSSSKTDIKGNCAFCYRSVFHSCSLYHRSALSFVKCHRNLSDLWFLFNVLFCNLMDIAVHVLPKAALHNPCKNDLFC